jgi:precorrin-3B synthase
MTAQDIFAQRRGWCPGVRRPMMTGDGLLVRIHPFGGQLTAGQARLIAEAAREYGNGHLDITARGNLQIRGVSEDTYPDLLVLLDQEGLVEPEGGGPNRLTVLSPLVGLDPLDRCDACALAQAIESTAGAVEGLPAKFFVAVDGGGLLPLDAIGADLHLIATDQDDVITLGVPSSNGLHWIGTANLAQTPETVQAILSGFAEMRRMERTEVRRLRDLEPNLLRELTALAELEPTVTPHQRPTAPRAGVIPIDGGQAVLLALPFGRCSTAQLEQVAAWSECFGTSEIRLSFTRGILLPRIAEDVSSLIDAANHAGFIIDAADPRLSLLACPGRPDCASGLTPAPADALQIAESCRDLLTEGVTLHVSGCPKGCAHPGKADLTLVGRDDGHYDLVTNGSTRDATSLHLSVDDLMTRLFALKSLHDLRHTFVERT